MAAAVCILKHYHQHRAISNKKHHNNIPLRGKFDVSSCCSLQFANEFVSDSMHKQEERSDNRLDYVR